MITISKDSCLINSSNLRIVSRTISDKDMDSTLIEIIIEKHIKHKEKNRTFKHKRHLCLI